MLPAAVTYPYLPFWLPPQILMYSCIHEECWIDYTCHVKTSENPGTLPFGLLNAVAVPC